MIIALSTSAPHNLNQGKHKSKAYYKHSFLFWVGGGKEMNGSVEIMHDCYGFICIKQN
jgi:hypothetical protein